MKNTITLPLLGERLFNKTPTLCVVAYVVFNIKNFADDVEEVLALRLEYVNALCVAHNISANWVASLTGISAPFGTTALIRQVTAWCKTESWGTGNTEADGLLCPRSKDAEVVLNNIDSVVRIMPALTEKKAEDCLFSAQHVLKTIVWRLGGRANEVCFPSFTVSNNGSIYVRDIGILCGLGQSVPNILIRISDHVRSETGRTPNIDVYCGDRDEVIPSGMVGIKRCLQKIHRFCPELRSEFSF